MSGTLSPSPKFTGFDDDGAIVPGGKLFTYTAGTSTKVNTYTDVDLLVPNTNPIILDSAGRAVIFLAAGSYKFVLSPSTDTDPPTDPIWSQDNIVAISTSSGSVTVAGTGGETGAVGQAVFLSDGTGSLTAGRWYLTNSSATHSSTLAPYLGFLTSSMTAAAATTIEIIGEATGLAGLSAGTIYYIGATPGVVTSSAPAYARKILVATGTTRGIIVQDPQYAIISAADVQSFVVDGVWTIPSNALWVDVICYGAGGGGAGGETVAGAGAASAGGPGGGGGARVQRRFQPSDLSSPVTVTVGVGGTGGTAGAGDATDGTSTTFGSYVIAYGGGGGINQTVAIATGGGTGGGSSGPGEGAAAGGNNQGGRPGGGTGGATVGNGPSSEAGGGGSSASGAGGPSVSGGAGGGGNFAAGSAGGAGGKSMFGGGAGGAGGGVTAANANSAGGAGGAVNPVGSTTGTDTGGGGAAGSAGAAFNAAQNGAAGTSVYGGTGGGGGGGRRDLTAAAAGGAGGAPSGGGGGGGAGQNGSPGGAGAAGGAGACYVITGLGTSQ